MIIQWVTLGSIGPQGSVQVTLPIAFPTLGFVAFANSLDGGFTATYRVNPTNPSKTAVSVGNTYTVAIPGAMLLVLGY
ncbi:gp53-like domain-containing protein [Paraburkholderia heleia]